MADIYFYQEDDGDDGDGVYGDSDVITNPDDLLPPIEKLEKYAESDNIFNRQVVARTILETLRVVTDDPDDVNSVLNVMTKLADDVEPSVRAELMEQVPHIAMYGQEYKVKLSHVVPHHLLPMVVKFLTDTNNQVRKTSQAALLVLLEQGLVERSDVQEQVCPVIIRLTEADSLDDYRTEAVALLSKMAPLIGKEMSEAIFLERFAALCVDPLFHVRKVCAANFGDFSNVVGSESTEQILLPKFFYLCEDGVWGVRKACADVFMPVSCVCSPSVRQSELSPLFINLLRDQSRWVRMAAFQALGPFISTFADSTITALLHNDNGEIVITDAEQLAQRLDQLEHSRAKLNNETNVDLVSSLGGEQDNSLSSYEDQLVVGVRKTDISESVETSSLELMPESSLTPSYFKSSSSSTSLLSSGSSSTLPSTTSATINENNNVETSEPGKTNVLHNISPDTDKISALQAINDENNSGNIVSSIKVSSDNSYDDGSICDNNCGRYSKNIHDDCSQKGDNPNLQETRNNPDCVKLTQDNDLSSAMSGIDLNDMELVNLEDEEHGDSLIQCDSLTEMKNIMSHSKSDSDLSSEERRAEVYRERLNSVLENQNLNRNSTVEAGKSLLPNSESFNDFHYWREPMVSLEIENPRATNTIQEFQDLIKNEDSEIENKGHVIKEISRTDLDDEIDDQVVLASLTGIITRPNLDENKLESNSFDLDDLDDLDVIKHDEKLKEVNIVDLKSSHSLDADSSELIVEPLTDSIKDLNTEKPPVDEDLTVALSEQLKISSQSSELIAETEYFLSNVKSEMSTTQDSLKLSNDASLSKDNTCGISNGAYKNSEEGTENKKEDTNEGELTNEQTEESSLFSDETTSSNIDQDQEESSMWQKCPVITFQTFDDLTDSNDSSTMELFRPGTVQASANISTFDPFDTTTTFRGGASVEGDRNNIFGHGDATSANVNSLNPPDPALPKGPPATLQAIVPQLLVDHYVSMIDPSRAQTVDNEIARHCAFSLPAVALTLGRSNWPLLKDTYEALASDMQWKVRRTLASSIHELGIILGEEAAGHDLIPIFNGFLKDLDEVRIGLLKHLADFLKLLKHSDRKEYLPRLSEFLKMDNERNWRFREELAKQIGHLVVLFNHEEVKEHLSPIALVLLKDKVSAVRQSSVNVHTAIIKYLLHGYPTWGDSPMPEYYPEDGASLARVLLAELVEDLARVDQWTHRQTYALLCHHIFNSSAVDNSQFAADILPNLIDLAWDKVPNVRLVVARALHTINQTAYFTTEANPHLERMEESISSLKNDKDPDVRAYFNPPPSLSTCESTSEYFDSDGEPIGDVSSLPV